MKRLMHWNSDFNIIRQIQTVTILETNLRIQLINSRCEHEI